MLFRSKNLKHFSNIKFLQAALWGHDQGIFLHKGLRHDSHFVSESGSDNSYFVHTITLQQLLSTDHSYIDILKIDIEGGEKFIFQKDFESWLLKVKVLMIEMHDRMIEGCSKSVFNALSKYNFSVSFQGEIMVCINMDIS